MIGALQAAAPVATWLGLAAFMHFAIRRMRGGLRGAGAALAAAGAVAMPWTLPADPSVPRFFAAIYGFVMLIRVLDVAFERYPAPEPSTHFGRFLFTCFCGPDVRWPADEEGVAAARAEGRRRLRRGLVAGVGAGALFAVSTAWPELHGSLPLQATWALATSAFLLPGMIALITGAVMAASGLDIARSFDAPALSRSPRDFWSRRWNKLFQNAAQRHLFRPLGARRRPVVASIAVFAFSAALHEYIVIASVGWRPYAGWMTAFFSLQCAATLADYATRRSRWRPQLPRPVAIAVHTVWFWATFPLFMVPIFKALPVDTIRLW